MSRPLAPATGQAGAPRAGAETLEAHPPTPVLGVPGVWARSHSIAVPSRQRRELEALSAPPSPLVAAGGLHCPGPGSRARPEGGGPPAWTPHCGLRWGSASHRPVPASHRATGAAPPGGRAGGNSSRASGASAHGHRKCGHTHRRNPGQGRAPRKRARGSRAQAHRLEQPAPDPGTHPRLPSGVSRPGLCLPSTQSHRDQRPDPPPGPPKTCSRQWQVTSSNKGFSSASGRGN